jgi:hypothetical protein
LCIFYCYTKISFKDRGKEENEGRGARRRVRIIEGKDDEKPFFLI